MTSTIFAARFPYPITALNSCAVPGVTRITAHYSMLLRSTNLARWDAREGDIERQHQLVKLLVERVYVDDDVGGAMTLKSDYHVVLGQNANEPTFVGVNPTVQVWAAEGIGHARVPCRAYPEISRFTNQEPVVALTFLV